MRLIVLISMLATFTTISAQHPELLTNTWYLQNLRIDGNDIFPPSNSEVPYATVAFDVPGFETAFCDALTADISYKGTTAFSLSNVGLTFLDCEIQVNTDFDILYIDTFYVNNLSDPFSYTIVMEGNDSKTLTITGITGDDAVYNTELLSNKGLVNSSFVIYPNPVEDELILVNTDNILGDYTIKIFDIGGRQIHSESYRNTVNMIISVTNFSKGIYFIELHSGNYKMVKRFLVK